MSLKNLVPKQRRFVEEYLVDLNGAQAAIRAGYSADTARQIASELLTKPDIAAAVQELMDARAKRTAITADRVLAEMGKIAFSDMRKVATWHDEMVSFRNSEELDDDSACAVQHIKAKTTTDDNDYKTVTIELKLHDKLKALEMCARHLKLFGGDDDDSKTRVSVTIENIADLCKKARDPGEA